MAKKGISIVVPVFNEETNLKPLVESINLALTRVQIPYELVIIDDNSTDESKKVIKNLSKNYPIRYYVKKGPQGKATSLIEGFTYSSFDIIGFIDADLQYPPDAIPEMMMLIERFNSDIVVANRKFNNIPLIRRIISSGYRTIFGKLLHGFNCDIQSGLKVFKKEIIDRISLTQKGWAFDLEFLYKAREAGYTITDYNIRFNKRTAGSTKINIIPASIELARTAIALKFKKSPVIPFHKDQEKLKGKGFHFKGTEFVHHSDLHMHESAFVTVYNRQKLVMFLIAFVFGALLFLNFKNTLIGFIAILTILYFIDLLFNLFIITRSFVHSPEIQISDEEIKANEKRNWPMYTIFCPLYKEWRIVPQFIEAINNLDYPKDKLQVQLLLEEDDEDTLAHIKGFRLPDYFETIVVPHSVPKTKPKATNYGLMYAKGQYSVIYDAEDVPDPLQLKKAVLGFEKSDDKTVCIQAKLNYYNPHQNLLTRIFTAEYSLWFDLILTGLQSIHAPIPLGGTSNHFKTNELVKLKGWDSFNVTEDCDLGIRLAKKGYQTAIIDSVTMEEANSELLNWILQRSRWIKGYIQSYLVHMRNPIKFFKKDPRNFFAFQLIVGGKILSLFINPFMWLITILYFVFRATLGVEIEKYFPTPVLYMAVLSLIFGNFLYLYYYMIGCAKKKHWQLIKYVYIVPLYWLAMSIAAWKALTQLIYKPHFWAKTIHGLHLDPTVTVEAKPKHAHILPNVEKINQKTRKTWTLSTISSGTILVIGYMGANALNFLFNISLGRLLSFEDFGLLTFVNAFTYLISILLFSLASTLTHKISFLSAKYGPESGVLFLKKVYLKSIQITLVVAGVWTLLIPFMMYYFNLDSVLPLLMFFPILFLGLISSLNEGYLQGNFFFISLAIVTISAPLIKLLLGLGLTFTGFDDFVYLAIPIASIIPLIISSFIVFFKIKKVTFTGLSTNFKFPRKFFASAIFSILSLNLFLTMDVLMTKHYLSPVQVGEYALIGVIGKIVFYFGSVLTNFMTAFVSRDEGANRNPEKTFNLLLAGTVLFTCIIFTIIGPLGWFINPLIFGDKVVSILPLITPYALAMSLLTISSAIFTYHLARHHYIFPIASVLSALLMVVGITNWHTSVSDIVYVTLFASTVNISLMLLLHFVYRYNKWIKMNIRDFLSLFVNPHINVDPSEGKQRILFYNWYCIRHAYSGGAEYYLHNIAKSLAQKGHSVTFFCGNDGKLPANEIIDGVQIVRHGGLFTVALWGFIYYITKFKHNYDVIIDSAKGVPFFTPLYAKQPVISVICHIHKNMFKKELPLPLAYVAIFLETKAMPIVYKKVDIITISPSIKNLLKKMGYGKENTIHIVYPGVNDISPVIKKTSNPSLVYLGRLREYKHIDVLVYATEVIRKQFPNLKVTIAGDGESEKKLKKLTKKLNLEHTITFTGRISEKEKELLFAKSWVAVHPSIAEGWGISNIEANLCGTPVVASDIEGLRDSVINGKTGYLVKSKDVTEFSNAIIKLLKNKKLRESMAKEGILWARQFSWDSSADSFYKVFHKMIFEKRNIIGQVPSLQNLDIQT